MGPLIAVGTEACGADVCGRVTQPACVWQSGCSTREPSSSQLAPTPQLGSIPSPGCSLVPRPRGGSEGGQGEGCEPGA